jgi:hypothetical protein
MSLRLDLHLLLRRALPLLAIALLIAVPALRQADAATPSPDLKGTVDKRPVGVLLGDWVIAGQNISVTNQTIFLGFGDNGPQVGACVEVAYNQASQTTRIATRITPDNDCVATGDPSRLELKGKIASQPEQGANGTWKIGDKLFEVSNATFFEGFGSTRPLANACVEVSYAVKDGVNVALRIRPDDTCNGPSSDHSFRGPVDSRPSVKVGDWVIGGRTFAVTADTAFAASFSAGQPAVGDCVGLTYTESATARTVATIFPANCAGDLSDKDLFEAHGTVGDPWPGSATFGTWTISGVSYEARNAVASPTQIPATVFEEKYGKLDKGACVQVHYRLDGTKRVAVRIETEPSFRCTSSAEDHELYGQIKQLPDSAGQLGTWKIGDLTVVVTPETKLTGAPFALDQLVEVKFERAGDGTLLALSIEVKRSAENEKERKGNGKAYGVLSTIPATSPVGTWTIGSTSYSGTSSLRLATGYTPKTGDCVEVYFQTSDTGARTALKISPEDATKCQDASNTNAEIGRVYSSVTAMPATGYVGSWTIAGVVYSATAATVFTDNHGPLTVGAFVEIVYVKLPNNSLQAQQIRTIVPPGAGDDNHRGKLEIPAAPKSLAAAPDAVSASWVIGGKTYLVSTDTLLNDAQGAIQSGTTVMVNAYTDAAGNLVATQVSSVSSSYLPIIRR